MNEPYKISVPVFVTKRRENWIAYCPVLKTYGYSNEGEDQALADFDRAIDTFFHIHAEFGTLNQTLLALGWTRKEKGEKRVPKVYTSEISPFRREKESHRTNRDILVPA